MSYKLRDEITTAVEAYVRDFTANDCCNERYAITLLSSVRNLLFILLTKVQSSDIDDHFMTSQAGSPLLDILVRTSGVNCLSDFFLWQVRSI
jgi:ditrans,polycis-polyprenyl diphosphate synthase